MKPFIFPSTSRPCSECGGQRVVTRLTIEGEGTLVELYQPMRSTGLFSGKSNTSQLHTLTCTNCGFTTLFAAFPTNLIPDQE